MSDDDKGDEWDRMSLNSLKRELEVQKTKTETARDEAADRIREGAESSPRRTWMWVVGALVLIGGTFAAVIATVPSVREWHFELVSGHFDAGAPYDAGTIESEPEVDAGVAAPVPHHMRHHMHMTAMMATLDFDSDDDDPLGGID